MVESMDDLKTSQSIEGHRFPNFDIFDAKIASTSKKIITNPYFKKKVSLEEQKAQIEDRFLSGRQTASMIYEYFWSKDQDNERIETRVLVKTWRRMPALENAFSGQLPPRRQ